MEIKPIAWSHSRISDFKQCPKLVQHKVIIKDVKFTQTPEMAKGEREHKMFEVRIANGTPFPDGYEKFEPIAQAVIRAPGQALTETEMTLTRELTTTGWFAKDAWCRVKVDVMKINGSRGWAGDWKTGKVKFDEHQLKLTAAVMMTQWPELESVATSFIWLRDGILDSRVYTRGELARLWEDLLVEPGKMEECNVSNNWPANPGYYCAYCPVNGMGKCQSAKVRFKG